MIPPGRRLGVQLFLCVFVVCAGAARAAAQDPSEPPPIRGVPQPPRTTDTTRRADTTVADPPTYWLPTFPTTTTPGPLPWGVRTVFDADSLRFLGALTLADLLIRIPGVYIARGGFYGQAEVAFYGGRGGAGIELYWDGMPFRPAGRDSVFLDVGRIALAPLERVEVVRAPDRLRVDLITHNIPDTDARTGVVITTGDMDIGTYQAAFGRRWRSGLGLLLAANFASLNGDGITTTDFRQSDVWLKLEYVPRPTIGGSYQLVRSDARRDSSRLVDPWEGDRRDGIWRAFLASRADGLGWRVDGSVTTSSVEDRVTVDETVSVVVADRVSQTTLQLRHTWPRAAMTLVGRLGYGDRPRQVEWTGGWLPLPWLHLAGSARLEGHDDDRSASRFAGSVGLRLPVGFSARGEIVAGDQISAPRWPSDEPQRTLDWTGALRWDSKFAAVEIARVERDPFRPLGAPAGLQPVDSLGLTPLTQMLTVHAWVRPAPGFTLSVWYADPVRGGGDFEPPTHARYAATFSSKFWRVFRSGAFALRAEVAAESWSGGGPAGITVDTTQKCHCITPSGRPPGLTTQRVLPPGTFVDYQVEMQIVGVTLFWHMRNGNAMRSSYVPGLPFPTIVQFYGARWSFRH